MPAERSAGSATPASAREQFEQLFADYLGVRKVIWLGRGIAGDDTHGHVDDISRFVAPSVVLTAYEPDNGDVNHEPLRENFLQIEQEHRPVRQAPRSSEAAHARAHVI